MATYSPSTPVNRLGRGGDVQVPPGGDGGGENSRGSNFPNYGARLRGGRLGLICGIGTVYKLTGKMLKAGEARIFDLTPAEEDPFQVAVHTAMRVWIEGASLRI